MNRSHSSAFRPTLERVEPRNLATAGLHGAISAVPHVAVAVAPSHAQEYHAAIAQAATAHLHQTPFHVDPGPGHKTGPRFPPSGRPGIGPGIGNGLVRLSLPGNHGDFGVVTLWNNTFRNVSFTVSASTLNNGIAYPFSLRPGQFRSFYASVIPGSQFLPVFRVGFGSSGESRALPQDNVVFEARGWVPSGTAGWPYAINLGVNGYYISLI